MDFITRSHLKPRQDDDGDGNGEGLSEYELLRIQRIKRNQARLAQLGFSEAEQKKNAARQRQKKTYKPRKSLPDGPRRQLPGRAKRATFNESAIAEARKERLREEEERSKNMDACYSCQKEEGGEFRGPGTKKDMP